MLILDIVTQALLKLSSFSSDEINKIIGCHLKDFYDQSKNLLEHEEQSAVGDGFIDWGTLITEVKKTPCEVFVLEHDDPKDYKEYTTKSLANLVNI